MNEYLESAKERGTKAALEKYVSYLGFVAYTEKITNNPYTSTSRRRSLGHVAWHNAFYQARKSLGLGVMRCRK